MKSILKTISTVDTYDLLGCVVLLVGGIMVMAFGVPKMPESSKFWGLFLVILASSAMYILVKEDGEIRLPKPQMLRPRSVLDLPRNTRSRWM